MILKWPINEDLQLPGTETNVDKKYTKRCPKRKERISGKHILTVKFEKDPRRMRSEGVTGCTFFTLWHCRQLF